MTQVQFLHVLVSRYQVQQMIQARQRHTTVSLPLVQQSYLTALYTTKLHNILGFGGLTANNPQITSR